MPPILGPFNLSNIQSLDSFFLFFGVSFWWFLGKKKFIKSQYFFQEKAHKDVIVTVMLFLLLLLFIATRRVRSLTGGKCHIFYISVQLSYFALFQGILEIWFWFQLPHKVNTNKTDHVLCAMQLYIKNSDIYSSDTCQI